ncbi:oligopeptide/dipeptide ABC transporter ATP-binding protein [Bifidobacterium bifidum]|uniref:oligopeptide/dipeptide ABC transporter ATP-binding protein n=1 Tax=Bifidobacterium bifidum TaxID=1681 RepID=UPI0034A16B9F
MEPCQRTDHRLDVTIQAQILDLLMSLKDEYGLSALFITHDFGVVAQIAGKVAVMYAGRLLETGDVYDVFDHPAHPYTAGLLKTRPVIGRRVKRLYSLHDQFPDPVVFGRGTSRAGRAAPRTG